MPPLDVLRPVTTNAAELLGWQDRVGTVESGKFADLIALAGDPIADISELEPSSIRHEGRPGNQE